MARGIRLELRENNAFSSVLYIIDGEVVGAWDRDDGAALASFHSWDGSPWDETWPDVTDPDEYGELIAFHDGHGVIYTEDLPPEPCHDIEDEFDLMYKGNK